MNPLMQAQLNQNHVQDLLREAHQDRLARQVNHQREQRPGLSLNWRALLVRLNLA